MNSFLDCFIWSAYPAPLQDFYFIESVYKYNSNTTEYNTILNKCGCTQVPEFLIKNKEYLDKVNYEIINFNKIPILKYTTFWEIDLKYYEKFNSGL